MSLRFSEFNGVTLPANQGKSDVGRTWDVQTMQVSGSPFGAYVLRGNRPRQPRQPYRYDFMFTSNLQTNLDALLAAARTVGDLKADFNGTTRLTPAYLAKVGLTSTPEEAAGGIERVTCEFDAEPFWYANAATTVNFAAALTANVNNAGNERAIRYVVLTITSAITTSLTVTITPTSGTTCVFTYGASTASTLVVDAGAHSVQVGGVDRRDKAARGSMQVPFLFLEPGASVVTFSQAVSGSIVHRSCWL